MKRKISLLGIFSLVLCALGLAQVKIHYSHVYGPKPLAQYMSGNAEISVILDPVHSTFALTRPGDETRISEKLLPTTLGNWHLEYQKVQVLQHELNLTVFAGTASRGGSTRTFVLAIDPRQWKGTQTQEWAGWYLAESVEGSPDPLATMALLPLSDNPGHFRLILPIRMQGGASRLLSLPLSLNRQEKSIQFDSEPSLVQIENVLLRDKKAARVELRYFVPSVDSQSFWATGFLVHSLNDTCMFLAKLKPGGELIRAAYLDLPHTIAGRALTQLDSGSVMIIGGPPNPVDGDPNYIFVNVDDDLGFRAFTAYTGLSGLSSGSLHVENQEEIYVTGTTPDNNFGIMKIRSRGGIDWAQVYGWGSYRGYEEYFVTLGHPENDPDSVLPYACIPGLSRDSLRVLDRIEYLPNLGDYPSPFSFRPMMGAFNHIEGTVNSATVLEHQTLAGSPFGESAGGAEGSQEADNSSLLPKDASSLNVFPNPSNGAIRIDPPSGGLGKGRLLLLRSNADILMEQDFDLNNPATLDLSGYPKGNYFLLFVPDNGDERFSQQIGLF